MKKLTGRFVRIKLEYTVDPEEDPLSIDLKIDDQAKPIGTWLMFGLLGNPKNNPSDLFPLILHRDGLINFGGESEGRDRFWGTDLLSRRIVKGERVLFWSAPLDDRVKKDMWAYVIRSVAILGEREID